MDSQQQLIDQSIRRAIQLEGLKQNEVDKFAKYLREVDSSIRGYLSGNEYADFKRQELERKLKEIAAALLLIFLKWSDQLKSNLYDVADSESGFENRSLALATGATIAAVSLSKLKSALAITPLSVSGADKGKLISDFIDDFVATEQQRIIGTIRQGVFAGDANADIVKAIRGTKSNKFKDGVLDVVSRNAEAVTKTAIAHTANTARNEVFKANGKVVAKVKWISILDSVTSAICRSLSGMLFGIYDGPRPPAHIRCRSMIVAVLVDMFQTKQSSASDPTYYEWLQLQSPEFQDSVIGVRRGNLLRNGGLSADEFAKLQLNKNFKPLTLDQMKELEPLAFEQANI